MKPELILVLAIFLSFIVAEILFTRFFHKPGAKRGDAVVELVSSSVLSFITQPLVLAGGFAAAAILAPGAEDMLKGWPFLAVFALFLVFDDMMQYWWHRLSHTVPWLYKLHRPHHNAAYMSIRIVYRNNLFYYLLMPSLWFSGA
ncbi:MAG: sterol desaturase family protein, partial [Pseudomonadota bacterium]